ncbi:MAG: transglycosylase family protein [Mycobacteriales bacterium]
MSAAAPALGLATPAHASGYDAWLRVANCEAGGNWATNTGNGYFGGLQFAESTWLAYGGGRFAYYANEATEWQQIIIGERVLLGQGVGAWPVCGPQAGLTMADAYDGVPGSVVTTALTRPAPKPVARPVTHHAVQERPRLGVPTPSRGRHAAVAPAGTVVVQRGQTLSSIAADHKVSGGWEALWRANIKTVRNPNLIFPGQRLVIPHS